MYCQKCGAQLDADARFCKACGTAAGATPQPYTVVVRFILSSTLYGLPPQIFG